jgi:twitching motility two-component system response regulator PilH
MREIYCVLDEQESPDMRRHCLELFGYQVRSFRTGTECLVQLEERKPALVILDVLIQGENGFEICRAIRDRFSGTELPIIVCSTIYRDERFHRAAIDAGAQRFVLRPIDADDLVEIVHDVVSARDAAAVAT